MRETSLESVRWVFLSFFSSTLYFTIVIISVERHRSRLTICNITRTHIHSCNMVFFSFFLFLNTIYTFISFQWIAYTNEWRYWKIENERFSQRGYMLIHRRNVFLGWIKSTRIRLFKFYRSGNDKNRCSFAIRASTAAGEVFETMTRLSRWNGSMTFRLMDSQCPWYDLEKWGKNSFPSRYQILREK